eukprot:3434031-Ditylum_brightwellii.AAC.2
MDTNTPGVGTATKGDGADDIPAPSTESNENITAEMDARYGPRRRTGLRPRKLVTYSALAMINKMAKNDLSLPDYTRLYASLHCQLGSQAANIMTCPTITTILTQYH